jgi:DNA ligase (NAD+)
VSNTVESDLNPPVEPADKPVSAMSLDELVIAVRYHNWRYFVLADPILSDYAFDALTRRLAALAPDHPALAELTTDVATGSKVFHDSPMLSLEKAYDGETVEKWAAGFLGSVVESPKIDGVAASLKYDEQGKLYAAVTRGDGKRGESFIDNARFISAIPASIGTGPVEVRGEIYQPLSVFRARFAAEFSNPRNTTAGAIKQKVPARTADYGLSFFAYSVRGKRFDTVMDWVAWGKAHGLPVVESKEMEASAVEAGYQGWLARREGLDFEVDGVVYTANRSDEHERLGQTAHHPRYAIAYKFQGESGTTILNDIEWSVSRSGAITPVALIEPISLSGAMVSRCSLHNLAILEALGASPGATVVAMRRGGVIPHIEAVVEPSETPLVIPETCPVSGHATERIGDVLMCSEPHQCRAAILGTLEYWAKSVEIDGLGPKVLMQLLDRALVSEPADFFTLTLADLMRLERMGQKLGDKLLANISSARALPLPLFLKALGADSLGAVAAEKLAETFGTLDAVLDASEEAIAEVYGLGTLTAEAIRAGLDSRRALIANLREHVVVEHQEATETQATAPTDHPFSGHSFVFTGKLQTLDRKAAQALVKAYGGTTPSGVSKALNFLVIGDDGSALLGDGAMSSKHKKAETLVAAGAPLEIISEAAFRAMVDGETA